MSGKIKIGIIGVGSISEAHLLGYSNIPDVEIYAFCDINEKRLKDPPWEGRQVACEP